MELKEIALIGLIFFGVLGLCAGAALAIAAVRFKVKVDPTIEAVKHVLSGANCGACAFPGCEAYAEAVVADKDVSPDLCRPGGPETASRVAKLTGKVMGSLEPVIAFRSCLKNEGEVGAAFRYSGMCTCQAANLALNGPDACKYSCLGFADCVRTCPFQAIRLQDGLPEIDPQKCTGCGLCVKACPKNILELIPRKARVMVFCSSKDKAKAVMSVCKVGCIACGKCVRSCPAQVISMQNSRIHIDHKTCMTYGPSCAEICVDDCPRNILRRLGSARKADHKGEKAEEKPQAKDLEYATQNSN